MAIKNNIPMAAYGKVFILAYSFGDRIHVHETWWQMTMSPDLFLKEQQFALEESLHGKEILAATAISLNDQQRLIITGSEDTYIKVSVYNMMTNKL